MIEPAVFIHDTKRVISVNNAACEMFRCEWISLVDLDMIELINSADMKSLARLRLRVMLEKGPPLPNIKYPFLRCDGTTFWGSVFTRRLRSGEYETTVMYEYER